jgi:carboxyl-terminal processing protease
MRFFQLQLPIWLILPLTALSLVIGIGGGYFAAVQFTNPCTQSAEVCNRFENFWKAWDIAAKNYVDPSAIDPQRMTDGAIEGMLNSLGDQGHTRYLSADTARRERESLAGRFEGIGAFVSERNGQIILNPMEGTPAERAGVLPGDLLLKVNGESVTGMSSSDVSSRVRGPKDTQVTLTVLHEGEELPVDITVTRDEIRVPAVTWRMLPENIALIKLNQFSQPSSEEMRQALTEAQAQNAAAVVLDLRNNPGGLVNELIAIAGEFLPKDTTVLIEQDRSGTQTPYKTRETGVAQTIPVVVLVNGNSASSAEILAVALKEQGRATVIGVPTFGTATVLRPFELDDGAQVRLGTTQWLTPNGEVVRGRGIQPNEIIALEPSAQPLSPTEAAELTLDQLKENEDIQLARAITLVQEMATRPIQP